MNLEERIKELDFSELGIYCMDTRSFKYWRDHNSNLHLYILQSKPLNSDDLENFIKWLSECGPCNDSKVLRLGVSEGYWSLKYIYIISNGNGTYYVLNRYRRKIDWEKATSEKA